MLLVLKYHKLILNGHSIIIHKCQKTLRLIPILVEYVDKPMFKKFELNNRFPASMEDLYHKRSDSKAKRRLQSEV